MSDSKRYDLEKKAADNGDVNQMTLAGDTPYAGMPKSELARFSQQPFWIRLRWFLFILFWLTWLALLVGAIVIIATTPLCSASTESKWWQTSIIYQIYPQSYLDTDGDGKGDIKGISSKLDYLTALGVGAVWLNPIYKSPQVDNGYDVEDYRQIDPVYGSMEDFDKLVQDLHDKDMKIIMDFIPNHTSDKHRWFEASRANNSEENIYRDYYVWKDGDPGTPPNNWVSVFGGRAWTYDSTRAQWYLHQFLKEQPDLNIRNTKVQQELEDILRFWLDKGVDGFRIDAIKHLYEAESFADEPQSGLTRDETSYDYLNHSVSTDQPETYDIIKKWGEMFDSYEDEKVMITEAYSDVPLVMKYFEYGADIPFNFQLITTLRDPTACEPRKWNQCIYRAIQTWLQHVPTGKTSNWVVGNHDNKRIASQMGEEYVNSINIMLLLLPGTPTIYYGDEIGMKDNTLYYSGGVFNRNYCRTPMQWNDDPPNAGFTSGNPWLPVNSDYASRNVESQMSDAGSELTLFQNVTRLRGEPAFVSGETALSQQSANILAFTRQVPGDGEGYLVILNLGDEVGAYTSRDLLPDTAKSTHLVLKTPGVVGARPGEQIAVNSFNLQRGHGMVVKYTT